MTQPRRRPMRWTTIIAVLIGTAVASGVTLGLVGEPLGLPPGLATVGVGLATGSAAGLLLARRRAAMGSAE